MYCTVLFLVTVSSVRETLQELRRVTVIGMPLLFDLPLASAVFTNELNTSMPPSSAASSALKPFLMAL